MALAPLLGVTAESPAREDRDRIVALYAQSWALTDMLVFAPE